MRRDSKAIALLAVLTALPTALGYVLGPLTHSLNAVLSLIPFNPVRFYLGFMPLLISTVLARAYLGRGGAIVEGLLLAITGVFLHPTKPIPIILLKDVLLGLGVEVSLIGSRGLRLIPILSSSLLGGLGHALPFLIFSYPFLTSLWFIPNMLLSALIGGYLAYLILKRLPDEYSSKTLNRGT
ncbi:hypothetical protein DRO49_06165 [Candidatus Bathyarchaeota archaeon]|nr:MAG: hypothetical protein DRO49_06165 [Candidatus Bathyarchaeota archaeon]